MTNTSGLTAVLFDFSGTLFRLEEDDSWFDGITVDERSVDGHVQAELMRRVTAPTGSGKQRAAECCGIRDTRSQGFLKGRDGIVAITAGKAVNADATGTGYR